MLLQNRFSQIDSQINFVESEISKLQIQLSELQNHRQHLQSVEQACESALGQIDTALMMLNHIDPDCVSVFKDAVMAKFDEGAIAILPPTNEPETEQPTEPSPEPSPEPETDTQIIDVTVSDAPEETEPEAVTEADLDLIEYEFDPLEADLDTLKAWVREHQDDAKTRQQGTLTRRSTWEHAAKQILSNG